MQGTAGKRTGRLGIYKHSAEPLRSLSTGPRELARTRPLPGLTRTRHHRRTPVNNLRTPAALRRAACTADAAAATVPAPNFPIAS